MQLSKQEFEVRMSADERDRPFDIQPLPSSRISDLDRYYYESKNLPATVAADILEGNDRVVVRRNE